MTSKTAQEYLDAAARVPEMDDTDLARWYADAVQQYTSLSLWSRLDHPGDTHEAAWRHRAEWCDAAAELFVAIENRPADGMPLLTGRVEIGEQDRVDRRGVLVNFRLSARIPLTLGRPRRPGGFVDGVPADLVLRLDHPTRDSVA